MSNILILKVDEDGLTEEEGVEIIKNIAENFGLRVTVGDRKRDEDQRWDIMDMASMHDDDLRKSLERGDLAALIDEDEGIIGYLIRGNEDAVLSHLNGTR